MKNLISMTDFVLEQMTIFNSIVCEDRFELENYITLKAKIENYANFLKQPLTLGMFIPAKLVDGVWVVLEEPRKRIQVVDNYGAWHDDYHPIDLEEYKEAKERVLFENFEVTSHYCNDAKFEFIGNDKIYFFSKDYPDKWNLNEQFKIIEDLVKYNLVLTESAKQKIGL